MSNTKSQPTLTVNLTLNELKVKAFDKAFEVQALKEAVIKAQSEQEKLLQTIKDFK